MLNKTNGYHYLSPLLSIVEKAYDKATATGKVARIMLNFGFLYGDGYTVVKPNYDLIMNP